VGPPEQCGVCPRDGDEFSGSQSNGGRVDTDVAFLHACGCVESVVELASPVDVAGAVAGDGGSQDAREWGSSNGGVT
jgi:hypothetical protein